MYVFIFEIMQLIMMKMKVEMKHRSHRCNIKRSKSRHKRRYSKYKKRLNMMTILCMKLHVSNI